MEPSGGQGGGGGAPWWPGRSDLLGLSCVSPEPESLSRVRAAGAGYSGLLWAPRVPARRARRAAACTATAHLHLKAPAVPHTALQWRTMLSKQQGRTIKCTVQNIDHKISVVIYEQIKLWAFSHR